MARIILLSLFFGSVQTLIIAQQTAETAQSVQSIFPEFLSPNAKAVQIFQTGSEVRKAVPQSNTVPTDGHVLNASRSSRLGMEWGDTVEVQAIICDKETITLVENSVLSLLREEEFQPLGAWDGRGFLKAERVSHGLLFKNPPPQYESVHLVVKLDGQPANLAQYITLIYAVQAGPRPQYDRKAWSDQTDNSSVKTYIGVLSNLMHDRALVAIKEHCSKVDSGPVPTEKAALEKMDAQLTSNQAQSVRTALAKTKNERKH